MSFGSDLFAPLVPLQEHHRFPGVIVDGADAVVLGRLAGVGIITCWPFGLHMARSVGNQLRLNSSAY